jgi:hypothetical protein
MSQWLPCHSTHQWRCWQPWWAASGNHVEAPDHAFVRATRLFWDWFTSAESTCNTASQLRFTIATVIEGTKVVGPTHACIPPQPSSPPTILKLTAWSSQWIGNWWRTARLTGLNIPPCSMKEEYSKVVMEGWFCDITTLPGKEYFGPCHLLARHGCSEWIRGLRFFIGFGNANSEWQD